VKIDDYMVIMGMLKVVKLSCLCVQTHD